jgi:4-hydroxy-tetrahydrodipicolinate synthase
MTNDQCLSTGEDGMARDYVLQGGDGVISVTANVAPCAVAKVMAAAAARDAIAAEAADSRLAALHRDLFCEANPIPVKWALAKMEKTTGGIRSPLAPLGLDFHARVEAALQQANCIESAGQVANTFGWPSRDMLLQGHLFDQGLINQALEIIEKRGGDFEISSFTATPNDQMSEFNFRRTSSVQLKVYGVDDNMLDDITERLNSLVQVLESAEGVLTVMPADAA